MRAHRVLPLALIVALASAPLLAGCANPVESVIEGVTGGEVDLGGAELPDGFPAEVPIIEGEILAGVGAGAGENKVWNVTVRVDSASAFDDISAQLEGAGFTAQADAGAVAEGTGGAFANDSFGVLVVISPDSENGFVANYTVTPAGQ